MAAWPGPTSTGCWANWWEVPTQGGERLPQASREPGTALTAWGGGWSCCRPGTGLGARLRPHHHVSPDRQGCQPRPEGLSDQRGSADPQPASGTFPHGAETQNVLGLMAHEGQGGATETQQGPGPGALQMRVLCQDLRPRRPGEDSDQLWGPRCGQEAPQLHTCARVAKKHWMGGWGAAWQPDLWPLARSVLQG